MDELGQDGAEEKVQRLRRTLDAEFEEFVSKAAHDLREPLRDVAAYSQLIAETCDGRLDSEIVTYLEHIQEGAAKMQSLLADVVDYWTTSDGDRPPARTDMEAVLDQALLCTDREITERSATVTHDPLPPVMGDFEMLTKVLRHLIRNAIEYGGSPAPRVHVSSGRVDLNWVFSVQDNGAGIDPAFQGRLFGAFKRLHGKEYPGNGLGLAFCKKAIAWHGGRIWVESTPGAGATFYFTLPPAD